MYEQYGPPRIGEFVYVRNGEGAMDEWDGTIHEIIEGDLVAIWNSCDQKFVVGNISERWPEKLTAEERTEAHECGFTDEMLEDENNVIGFRMGYGPPYDPDHPITGGRTPLNNRPDDA